MASGIENTTAAAAATAPGSSAATDRAGIADNFDAFLLLLTTQLRNQSPLDPLDTNQFTQQLVQFASVEQQIKTNESLNSLLSSSRASNIATAATFVGMHVKADGATTQLNNGAAAWTLNLGRSAAQATIDIVDAAGNTVATQTRPLAAGSQTFSWDGRTSTGQIAPDGPYSVVINARDVSGQPVPVSSEIGGIVDGLDLQGSEPVLMIGAVRIPLEQIKGATRI
ncbi:MAG TPA: flagellar hook capping FlgD N-terminal domain-containing protein [Saliniramus sp.]|nr:flagellar hook capping FlgD N-terminal domain-containing protein [Saliniramus sp.]